MGDSEEQNNFQGRIEGGIDAIVIGADADGLVASAYLAKAGLRTILLESSAQLGGPIVRRSQTPSFKYVDGDQLISMLDRQAVADLDLYRHGIVYAARRLSTVYFFEDGQAFHLDGDLSRAGAKIDEEQGSSYAKPFFDDLLRIAAYCRPLFEQSAQAFANVDRFRTSTPSEIADKIMLFLGASAEEMLDQYLPDGALKTAMLSEASLERAAAPYEPFSFMSLVRRWSGEVAGLQAGYAYPKGGTAAVIDALRRAAQAANVEIRAATKVSAILIENDTAAGVRLENGGQLRAPLILAAMDAKSVFEDMIGAANIDLDFQRAVARSPSDVASARFHLVLKGVAKDHVTKQNMTRRIVYAPSRNQLRRAFMEAKSGRIAEELKLEIIFPDVLEGQSKEEKTQRLSVLAHPIPFTARYDETLRAEIEAGIVSSLEKFMPGITKRITDKALRLPDDLASATGRNPGVYAAQETVLQQLALARLSSTAGYIGGLYFCGAETRIGDALSGGAGRIAARQALKYARQRGRSA